MSLVVCAPENVPSACCGGVEPITSGAAITVVEGDGSTVTELAIWEFAAERAGGGTTAGPQGLVDSLIELGCRRIITFGVALVGTDG